MWLGTAIGNGPVIYKGALVRWRNDDATVWEIDSLGFTVTLKILRTGLKEHGIRITELQIARAS